MSQVIVADFNSHPGAMCDEGVAGREVEQKGVSASLSVALPTACEGRGSAQLPFSLRRKAWLVCTELWGELCLSLVLQLNHLFRDLSSSALQVHGEGFLAFFSILDAALV